MDCVWPNDQLVAQPPARHRQGLATHVTHSEGNRSPQHVMREHVMHVAQDYVHKLLSSETTQRLSSLL